MSEWASTKLTFANLDVRAKGLRLYRVNRAGDLIACELVMFEGGAEAVDTVLRRAAISGRVEIEPAGSLPEHFADVYVDRDTWTQSVALDAGSYEALKTRWMRTRLERPDKARGTAT